MMVRKVSFKLYKFNELSDEVKKKVLNTHRYALVDGHDWYRSIYDLARKVGFVIESFDLDRWSIKLILCSRVLSSIEEVLKLFGEGSGPYNLAKSYYDKIMKLANSDEVRSYLEEYPGHDVYDAICNLCLDEDFYDMWVKDMKQVFLNLLEDEFSCLTSDAVIIDMFESNSCEFFESGKVFNKSEFVDK